MKAALPSTISVPAGCQDLGDDVDFEPAPET